MIRVDAGRRKQRLFYPWTASLARPEAKTKTGRPSS
jgi:hypothetical protein